MIDVPMYVVFIVLVGGTVLGVVMKDSNKEWLVNGHTVYSYSNIGDKKTWYKCKDCGKERRELDTFRTLDCHECNCEYCSRSNE